MNSRDFVLLKVSGRKISIVVNLNQVVSVDLIRPLRLQLANGLEVEVDPDEANEFVKTLQQRTMYADGTRCDRPFEVA